MISLDSHVSKLADVIIPSKWSLRILKQSDKILSPAFLAISWSPPDFGDKDDEDVC